MENELAEVRRTKGGEPTAAPTVVAEAPKAKPASKRAALTPRREAAKLERVRRDAPHQINRRQRRNQGGNCGPSYCIEIHGRGGRNRRRHAGVCAQQRRIPPDHEKCYGQADDNRSDQKTHEDARLVQIAIDSSS